METTTHQNLTRDDWGKLVLRITIAGLMLFHGIAKVKGGVHGIAELLETTGIPRFVVYGVYIGEIVAPLMILLGYYARPAAIVFVFNMVVAIWLVHAGDIFKLGDHGAWAIELQMLYLLGAIAIALLGAGSISLKPDSTDHTSSTSESTT